MSSKSEKRRSSRIGPTSLEIRERWPLHWLVWEGKDAELEGALKEGESDHEELDPRGRTPLHLAVVLGKVRCADVLLRNGGNALALNRHKWTVLQEAVAMGNPELIGLVLRYRDQQQAKVRSQEIPIMLERLQSTPDYYIEMRWEVSSWVPFLSRMCPSDTYKIWKKGTTVRVDTTLVGFQQLTWQRGNLSFIFRAMSSGAIILEVNHDRHTVMEQHLKIVDRDPVETLMSQEVGVVQRLNSPIVSTTVDTDNVSFQRQKSGFWGFRSDKVETINGYDSKVFSATGLDIVSRTRVEHLPESEKSKHKAVNPLQDFLGAAQDHVDTTPAITQSPTPSNQTPPLSNLATPTLSMEEYFQPPKNAKDYDMMGRPVEVAPRVQKLKATVWLAEDFPLSLQEQILPIIDLMALNNSHFAQIKDFISLQMPAGFPVKFEIPLFHVMTASVTFGNINGHSEPAPHVSLHMEQRRAEPVAVTTPTSREPGAELGVKHRGPSHNTMTEETAREERGRDGSGDEDEEGQGAGEASSNPVPAVVTQSLEVCTISEECFTVPVGYHHITRGGRHAMADEEEELLQLAIQQSLMEQQGGGRVGMGEGGIGGGNLSAGRAVEEITLTEALNDAAVLAGGNVHNSSSPTPPPRPPFTLTPSEQRPQQHVDGGTIGSGSTVDRELELALALSRQQAEVDDRRRRMSLEDAELERVLRLSMDDK